MNTLKEKLLSHANNHQFLTTAHEICAHNEIPDPLKAPIKSKELENWFQTQALHRLENLPQDVDSNKTQNLLEIDNRYPDGSMEPISLKELYQMSDLCPSAKDILDRAKQGTKLIANNPIQDKLGTVARGVPGGGASSRAAMWARLNPDLAAQAKIHEQLPRPLYRVANTTLLQHTLNMSQHLARKVDRIFPNIVMTNSENANLVLETVRQDWNDYTKDELESSFFFNQIVLPRMWVKDKQLIQDKLYPAGHGDYPYLLAKYNIASTLNQCGVRYLVFSNADEWLWQADPVMISIANEFFKKDHHMVIIGTKNTNNQFGGGFVRKSDGSQSLVETPRLPWSVVKKGEAPVALNTTFYMIDLDYLAKNESCLLEVEKSLVVKEVPGREPGQVEQIIGVDSWAGDCFAAVLNPAFIEWPRLNFLGIKDGSFIASTEAMDSLGGRSYKDFMRETIVTYPELMSRLIDGNEATAQYLHDSGYSYLPEKP